MVGLERVGPTNVDHVAAAKFAAEKWAIFLLLTNPPKNIGDCLFTGLPLPHSNFSLSTLRELLSVHDVVQALQKRLPATKRER